MQEYQRILVALDVYSSYWDVLERALEVAKKPSDISLVFVTLSTSNLQPYVDDIGSDLIPEIRKQACQRLEKIAAKNNVPITQVYVPVGRPADEIFSLAIHINADLIILGSDCKQQTESVLGSTVVSMLQNVKRDVLVVKGR